MSEHRIDPAWVKITVRQPLRSEAELNGPALERRFREIPEFDGRILRVVCSETNMTIRIVTAPFDRDAGRLS
jgi:hypothetical protein